VIDVPLRSQILQRLQAQLQQPMRNSLPKATNREQSQNSSISTKAIPTNRASHQYLLTEGAESATSRPNLDLRTERKTHEMELFTTRDSNRTQREYER